MKTKATTHDVSQSVAPPVRVLVLGQTPPPYGGQALMIRSLVEASLPGISIRHVRMGFSSSMSDVGRFDSRKLAHLAATVVRVLGAQARFRASILYFPPAGPNRNPVLRDLLMLSVMRPFFRRTVLHFCAAGLSEFLTRQNAIFRWLAHLIYGRPDGAIQTSSLNPPDAEYLQARRSVVIPNGVPDAAHGWRRAPRAGGRVQILFAGVVTEEKGPLVLLQAACALRARGHEFDVLMMGEFASREFERQLRIFIEEHDLNGCVTFLGHLHGEAKWSRFREADIFCFPTFFDAESFGNVAVEAMMFELPVVATTWRGVPSIVNHGETGILVPPRDPERLASALEELLSDRELRARYGRAGRARYVAEFQLDRHLARMAAFFREVAAR